MAKLSVIISTLNSGISNLEKAVKVRHNCVNYIIVHQVTDSKYERLSPS